MENLLKLYTPYIYKLAKKINHNSSNIEDYVQIGYESVIKAYNMYKEDKGNFHQLAATYIKYAMLHYRDEDKLIKIPNNVKYCSHKAYQENNIKVDYVDISEYNSLRDYSDYFQTDNELIWNEVNKLNYLDSELIYLYYHDNLTLQEIGDIRGISKQAVSNQLNKALKRLKKRLKL